jgi:hypothetical protein
MENPFLGLSKLDLDTVLLRLLSELSNLRSDSRHLRQRLQSTRSELAHVQYQLTQVQFALSALKVIPFQKTLTVSPVAEPFVVPVDDVAYLHKQKSHA